MNSFFIILLVVSGYFAMLSMVMARLDNGRAIYTVAVIVLLIYGCMIGMIAAIGQYLGEAGLLIYAVSIIYTCLYWSWKIYRAFRERPVINPWAALTLAAYLAAVLYITIFMREGGTNSNIQMEVLNWMREDGLETFEHVLLNTAMFVPVGALFPFVTEGSRGKLVSGASFGMLFSLLIETGQLILRSGTCDIDDILSNSLGAFLGALAVVSGKRLLYGIKKPE